MSDGVIPHIRPGEMTDDEAARGLIMLLLKRAGPGGAQREVIDRRIQCLVEAFGSFQEAYAAVRAVTP